jgi:hypothetical protein
LVCENIGALLQRLNDGLGQTSLIDSNVTRVEKHFRHRKPFISHLDSLVAYTIDEIIAVFVRLKESFLDRFVVRQHEFLCQTASLRNLHVLIKSV